MKINVHSLNDGVHIFEFDLDSSELDLEEQDFSIKEISLKCTVSKGEKNVYITSTARTQVNFVCDICLVDFVDVLENEFFIFYTTDKETVKYDEEQVIQLHKPLQSFEHTIFIGMAKRRFSFSPLVRSIGFPGLSNWITCSSSYLTVSLSVV